MNPLQSERAKRFNLPQYTSSSPAINRANSENMQTPVNDVWSGAKRGVAEAVRSALPSSQEYQNPDQSTQPYIPDDGLNENNPRVSLPEYETTQVVPSSTTIKPSTQSTVRSGLNQAHDLADEAAGLVRSATSAKSPDMDALRQATREQASANNNYASFDPTKQPVSKLRKAAGIITGIGTGVLGGGVGGGINAYKAITQAPARDEQAYLKKQAEASTLNANNAAKVAQEAREFTNTGINAANSTQKIENDVQDIEKYNDTGRDASIAETQLKNDQSALAKADTQVKLRPPEPKITPVSENSSAIKTELNPATNKYESSFMSELKDKGIQKLSAGDEPIVRGYAGKHNMDPNKLISDYRDGDPVASAHVLQALHDEALARNPGMVFSSKQLIPTFGPDGTPTGALFFDPRTETVTPKTLEDMGLGNQSFLKNAPKDLGANDANAWRGAESSKELVGLIEDSLTPQLMDKLGAVSGRVNNILVDDIGKADPDVALLITRLKNLATFTAATHTGRVTSPIIKQFEDAVKGIKQDPSNLKAKLGAMKESADVVLKEIQRMNPNAKQVGAAAKQDRPAPPVGTIEDGHKFLGGDPAKPENWKEVK